MRIAPLAISAAVALAVGFGAGWLLASRRLDDPRPPSRGELSAGVAEALRSRDLGDRIYRLVGWLERADRESVAGAAEAVEADFERVGEIEVGLIARSWARLDRESALARIAGWPERQRRGATAALVFAWALEDPQSARAFVESLEEPGVRDDALVNLVHGWALAGHDGLEEFVMNVEREQLRGYMTAVMIEERCHQQGDERTLLWAESIPDDAPEDWKAVVLSRTAAQISRRDAPAVAAWADRLQDDPHAEGMMGAVMRSWLPQDPSAAVGWLLSHPASDRRDAALVGAYQGWLVADREAAEAWTAGIEPQRALDPVLVLYLDLIGRQSPAEAIAMADRLVSSAELRFETQARLLRAWRQRDIAAARRWIEESQPSQELIDAARRPIRRAPAR